jgi:DNA (cytosine-5)-methyltransferase 1
MWLDDSEEPQLGWNQRSLLKPLMKVIARVLNLYAGIGGNRKLWKDVKVTAVEIDPKIAEVYRSQHPDDEVIVGDAHQYLLEHANEFDIIWSTPPCQGNTRMIRSGRNRKPRYPDLMLYEEIIFLEHNFKGNWIVENVSPYYRPLIEPRKKVGRHLFWSNFEFEAEDVKRPKGFIAFGYTKQKQSTSQELKDWLGIHYEGNIYYNGNNCPAQVLRNCVHPLLGNQILEQMRIIVCVEANKPITHYPNV